MVHSPALPPNADDHRPAPAPPGTKGSESFEIQTTLTPLIVVSSRPSVIGRSLAEWAWMIGIQALGKLAFVMSKGSTGPEQCDDGKATHAHEV